MKPFMFRIVFLAAVLVVSSCTTMQTTYFRGSYQSLESADNAGFQPYSGTPEFMMVEDMADGALDMYGRGYAMLGYSQFVSPLLTNLAPSYSTKYGATLNAAYVVLQTPRPGNSNLHGYLVTYWAKVRPEQFTFGSYSQNLPEDLLKRLGEDYNLVMLRQIVPGTPAAGAGFKADDVVLAVNGVRVVSTDVFLKMLNENHGKEVLISISRQGKLHELPVTLAVPVQVSNAGYGFYEAPWENTKPTDWSSLSAANTIADVQRQQQAERDRQAAYERGRQAAMEARQNFDSNDAAPYGGYMRSREARASGQAGGYTREQRARGLPPPSPQQWKLEYSGAMGFFETYQFKLGEPSAVDIWFQNAPNTYGQLFTFPRPKAY